MFKSRFESGIHAGKITRTYRRWKSRQVKQGGTYQLMRGGAVEVTRIDEIRSSNITNTAATKAGFLTADELLDYIDANSTGGTLYCIEFAYLQNFQKKGPNLNALQDEADWQALDLKLRKKDQNSKVGKWTTSTLALIGQNPGMPSAKLAPPLKREQRDLKKDIRKLKHLGLTISLESGYKLSDRGRSYLEFQSALNQIEN